jgi:hypothetical protein
MAKPAGTDRTRPLFGPGATFFFRLGLALACFLLLGGAAAVFAYYHSPWWTRVGFAPDQPVPFSHRHHAGELRIDCRYCHSSVETSAFAGLPPTQTCLSCHSQIFADTALLRPVRLSAERGIPLQWQRASRLPDHVYFDHSIHVAKGVGCSTCHGDVTQLALAAPAERMDMRWCLDCHRDPAPALRPRDQLFATAWAPPPDQARDAAAFLAAHGVHPSALVDCSTCHR